MAIGMPGLYLARELDDCRPLLTLLTLLTLLSVALFPSASIGLPGPASRAPCPSCCRDRMRGLRKAPLVRFASRVDAVGSSLE